jgi:MFS family permease
MQPNSNIKKTSALLLPKGVWALGFVSLFMDVSSELIHSLLPIYMGTVLGISILSIGIIEGVAEATASITKIFSGAISDYFKRRKYLAVVGYTLGAIAKPLFPLATSMMGVFSARFIDRIGKGIRGAPRDALVADITPPELRGAAYGLRQSLDSLGAFLGPLLAMLFMFILMNDIKAVMWIAVIPAFIAVLILIMGVDEPLAHTVESGDQKHLNFSSYKELPSSFWFVVVLGGVFTLARFSEAFLILRAEDLGLAITYIPIIVIVMSFVYALFAYPAGVLADKLPAKYLLIMGLVVLIIADGILAFANTAMFGIIGAGFWGLHMALTQGLLAKLVADTAPLHLRGTAFGFFNLASGIALLLASVIAGALWTYFGASATFMAGALFAAITIFGLLFYSAN